MEIVKPRRNKDRAQVLYDRANKELDRKHMSYWMAYCYGYMMDKMTSKQLDAFESRLEEFKHAHSS